jgi:uncharacterized tellurite resistance protein B-like protein
MTAIDRAEALCDLMLGAAYADDYFHDNEKNFVRAHLVALCGGELPRDLAARIEAFEREEFAVERAAAAFVSDDKEQKRALLELLAALHDTDEELDFAEDDYLREVARAVGAEDALEGLALEYETQKLRRSFESLRLVLPPPVPSS